MFLKIPMNRLEYDVQGFLSHAEAFDNKGENFERLIDAKLALLKEVILNHRIKGEL